MNLTSSRRAVVAAAVAATLAAIPVHAQDASQLSLESLLNQQVSSASLFDQRVADAPSAVTVITAEDIRRMGAVDLPDVLRMVPGLNLRAKNKGSYSISARNAASAVSHKILVLVDGRTVAQEAYSSTTWESIEITLDQVEQIEVVRGPGSALYGANAYDGVVSITTRRPTGTDEVQVSLAGGDYGERTASAVARQSFGALRVDGFLHVNRADLASPVPGLAPGTTFERAGEFRKGGLRLGWSNPRGIDVEVSGGLSDGEALDYWSFGGGFTRGAVRNGYTQVNAMAPRAVLGADVRSRVYYGRRTVGEDSLAWSSERLEAEVTADRQIGAHRLVAGLHTHQLQVGTIPGALPEDTDQRGYGAFLQDAWKLSEHLEITAGARYDHHPHAGANLSPRASLLVRPSPTHTFRLSAGRAFRYPTVLENDQYSAFTVGETVLFEFAGSHALKPEAITSYEAGYIGAPHPSLTLTADVFRNQHEDEVGFAVTETVTLPNGAEVPFRIEYATVPGGTANGVELGATLLPREWLRLGANYAYVDLEDGTGTAIVAEPAHKLNAEVAVRPFRPLWVDLTYHYASEADYTSLVTAQGPAAYATVLPAGGVMHLNMRADLPRGLTASVFVQNLTDRRYQQLYGGEELGRRIVGKLSVSF
jgi:iron complex outermembrane receptor protein